MNLRFIDQLFDQMLGIRDQPWRRLRPSLYNLLYEQIDGNLLGSQLGNALQNHLDGKMQR
jgi:hypothetical protein